MVAAVRQTVPITEEGLLQVRAPEFHAGTTAEVIVYVRPDNRSRSKVIAERLAALNELQRMAVLTPEAAEKWVAEIRAEREAGDRFDRGETSR